MQYRPIDADSLLHIFEEICDIKEYIGAPYSWRVSEVSDGNLNVVFRVDGDSGSIVVKQALPFIRAFGESWPLSISRTTFEHRALVRFQDRAPGTVPQIVYFDEEQALIVMECFSSHSVLRNRLIAGEQIVGLGASLGQFCARIAFRG